MLVLHPHQMLKHAYRGRMRRAFLVGAPTAFAGFWKLLKGLLALNNTSPKTIQHISRHFKVFSVVQLLQAIQGCCQSRRRTVWRVGSLPFRWGGLAQGLSFSLRWVTLSAFFVFLGLADNARTLECGRASHGSRCAMHGTTCKRKLMPPRFQHMPCSRL